MTTATTPRRASFRALLTRERWIEIARIGAVGLVIVLYQQRVVPLGVLLAAVALGLYPLIKTGLTELFREHQIGTEIFVTIATTIAMLGGEYIASAILMVIILIAELIADLNSERDRASIKALIGSVPETALVRRPEGDVTLPLTAVRPGDVVIVRAGEKIPVDGVVRAGDASINQAPITGESKPSFTWALMCSSSSIRSSSLGHPCVCHALRPAAWVVCGTEPGWASPCDTQAQRLRRELCVCFVSRNASASSVNLTGRAESDRDRSTHAHSSYSHSWQRLACGA